MRHIKYAIIIFTVLFVLLGIFAVLQYRSLYRRQIMNIHALWSAALLRHPTPFTANDVNAIQPWMTFDYVNRLFALPPDFPKTRLSISNARYPKLSISGYAKSAHRDATETVNQVESAIRDYLTNGGT